MLIHFYETTKFFANFFTKRHPLPPISLFHFMEWGIPPAPYCPLYKGLTFFRNPPSPLPKGAPPLPIAPLTLSTSVATRESQSKLCSPLAAPSVISGKGQNSGLQKPPAPRNVLVSRNDAMSFYIRLRLTTRQPRKNKKPSSRLTKRYEKSRFLRF